MTGTTQPRRLQSWILPSFAWTTIPDVFGVQVPISDPDVVEFVATGSRLVDLHRTRAKAIVMAGLLGADGLRGQLEAAAWTVLRHTEDWKKGSKTGLGDILANSPFLRCVNVLHS